MKKVEYEKTNDGERMIYRCYSDTEVSELATNIECPHCGEEWQEHDKSHCGKVYDLECEKCEKEFKMHFDAD